MIFGNQPNTETILARKGRFPHGRDMEVGLKPSVLISPMTLSYEGNNECGDKESSRTQSPKWLEKHSKDKRKCHFGLAWGGEFNRTQVV